MDDRAEKVIRLHSQMESRRGVWENHWREVAERVRPNQNLFQMRVRPDGDKRNEKIFDDTAPLALSKFAAAVISMCFPPTQRYHRLTVHDRTLAKNTEVKRYLDEVNDILFKVRYSPMANFQSQSGEVVLDVGAFGTGILFVDDVLGIGIRYKSFPLAECYIAENAHGQIDTLIRKFEFTAHQAATMFGKERLPEKIQQQLEHDPEAKFWFLHAVMPNPDIKPGRKDYTGMPFWSCYVAYEDRKIISEGGFRTFPFAVPRFETAPREVYGRGPAMKVLHTIKTLNEMKKTIIRAAQKVVAPPIMLTDDASLQGFNVRSDALNYGYLGSNGEPLAKPFHTDARVDIGKDLMDAEREAINDAFFVTLFRILVDEPQITATEAMLRAQEKGQLLAPTMGQIQTGMLGQVVPRELDILQHAGALPPMPDALIVAGGEIQLEYQSPLNLAQRASEGVGILNTIQSVAGLAQMDPSVVKVFKVDELARRLAEINGVPADGINSPDEIAAINAETAKAAQLQQILQAAPVAASAAKDFAQAQALSQSAPAGSAPAILPQGA